MTIWLALTDVGAWWVGDHRAVLIITLLFAASLLVDALSYSRG
jgi:hypothetical protein